MSLPAGPTLICGLDGIDDFITVDNSATGSPYDLEYTDPWTMAIAFNVRSINGASANFFQKVTGGKGFLLDLRPSTSTTYEVRLNILYDASHIIQRNLSGWIYGVDFIMIISIPGGGPIDVMRAYDKTGNIIGTFGQSSGGVAGTTTIKNGGALAFVGSGFKGIFSHPSLWNVAMNNTQKDELAVAMAQDKVKAHSLYAANCTGYWKEFLPGKVVNVKNNTYNGTYSGFETP
jgi:hypothetical protein